MLQTFIMIAGLLKKRRGVMVCLLLLALLPIYTFAYFAFQDDYPDSKGLEFKVVDGDAIDTIQALITLAGTHTLSSPKTALKYYNEVLSLIKDLKIRKEEAGVYNFMGKVYAQQGVYDLAMEYYFKSLSLNEEIGDENAVTWAFLDIGNVYYVQQNYSAALDFYHRALKVFEAGADQYGIATTLNNIALVQEDVDQWDSALKLFKRSLAIRQEIGDQNLIAHSYTYIGRIYEYYGSHSVALEYFKSALDLYEQTSNNDGMASMLRYIANIYNYSGSLDLCISNLQKSIAIYIETGNNFGLSEAKGEIARVYVDAGQFENALHNAQQMKEISIRYGILPLQSVAFVLLSEIYEQTGNLGGAIESYKKHISVRDSIQSREVAETISRQEFLHEREKRIQELTIKENEITLLERNERINKFKKNALTTGLLLLLVIAVLVYSWQYNIHKKDREIISKNDEIQKTQKDLVEFQEKEKELLKGELDARQNELSNFALHIIQKNNLLHSIKLKLQLLHKCDAAKSREKLNEIIISLTHNDSLNNEIKQFQEKVDHQNETFFEKLRLKYPELTRNDKRLIALLRLNLTTKEIASLNNISDKAVEMGRYRLRKKLDLSKQSNLHIFLQEL